MQFDTSAIVDDRLPMHSVIPLAESNHNDSQSGLMYPSQIAGFNLNCNQVIMSQAELPEYGLRNGEGIEALTWAFFVGGARQTVMTQWRVSQPSNAQMISEIDKNLELLPGPGGAKPGSGAEAVRDASLKMIGSKDYRDPYYWAGFMVVGSVFAPAGP
jgi:CHAT domain-containing protein